MEILLALYSLRSLVQQYTPDPNYGPFATKVLGWGPNPREGKKSDQAHPPIHPTKYTNSERIPHYSCTNL